VTPITATLAQIFVTARLGIQSREKKERQGDGEFPWSEQDKRERERARSHHGHNERRPPTGEFFEDYQVGKVAEVVIVNMCMTMQY
jgi:hypothetical protein